MYLLLKYYFLIKILMFGYLKSIFDQSSSLRQIIGCPSAIEAAKEGLQEKIKDLDEEKQDRLLKSFKITVSMLCV